MQIRRSAREVGSWSWSVPSKDYPTIREQILTAQTPINVLKSERLLTPRQLQVFWRGRGRNQGGQEFINIPEGATLESLSRPINDSAPTANIDPFISYIKVKGIGFVDLPNSRTETFDGLAEVNIFHFPDSVDIELTIHHDVWFPHAFDGYPHPQIYELNTPRLTAALKQIESGLGQETEPGDGTFFGQPTQHGIFSPERDLTNDPDLLDVTDMQNVGWTFHEVPCH